MPGASVTGRLKASGEVFMQTLHGDERVSIFYLTECMEELFMEFPGKKLAVRVSQMPSLLKQSIFGLCEC
jgi:hypothetical protein